MCLLIYYVISLYNSIGSTPVGSVLFAIFINDLPNVLPDETSAALYADDTKVYKSIKSEADCKILQHALTSLEC